MTGPPGEAARRPRVRHRGVLAAPAGYDSLVTVGVSASGPVALWRGAHPRVRPMGPSPAALTTYPVGSSAPADVVELESLSVDHPLVQRIPAGPELVVGARCELRPEGPESNAVIIGADGSILTRGCLGDGIEHARTDDAGTIWVGYFDEGVYGNLGWGEPGAPAPLGHAGLVQWSSGFEKLWEYSGERTVIDDCYSLNVDGDQVWACTYSDSFPVIRVHEGRSQVFATTGVTGARGVVVDGPRVGILGKYDDPSAFVVGELTDDRLVETARGHLWLPDETPLPATKVHCRGAQAHFFLSADWFTVDLDDLG